MVESDNPVGKANTSAEPKKGSSESTSNTNTNTHSADKVSAETAHSAAPAVVSKETAVRKRTNVYHVEEVFGQHKKSSGGSVERNRSTSDDYKKHSTSEDYKKRTYEQKEKEREQLEAGDDSYSPRCYLIMVIASVLVAASLGVALYIVDHLEPPPDVIKQEVTYCHESARKAAVIMSDNLDCSIYMKRLTLQRLPMREVVLHGIMCLYVNEPHSVAPDSGFSVHFFYNQNRDGLVKSNEQKKLKGCKDKEAHCDLRKLASFTSSLVMPERRSIVNSGLLEQLHMDPAVYKRNLEHHYQRFNRQDRNSKETNLLQRVYRVSRLYAHMLHNGTTQASFPDANADWNKLFNITSMRTIQRGDKLAVTEKVSVHVTEKMVNDTKVPPSPKAPKNNDKNFYPIDQVNEESSYRVVELPVSPDVAGGSCSIISAFVTIVSYGALSHNRRIGLNITEAEMYAYLLKAQHKAYVLLPNSKEWFGNKKEGSGRPSLLDSQSTAEAIRFVLSKVHLQPILIKRNPDRVATIINWKRGPRDAIMVANLGLPSLFGSEHIRNDSRKEFERFIFTNSPKNRSVPFMSSATLMVKQNSKQNEKTGTPLMVVSASGSVRTVEAVATTLVRQLTFPDEPLGFSIHAPGAFIDPRDGSAYCDKERSKESAELFKEMEEEFGVSCSPIRKNDVMHNDRMAMAVKAPKTATGYMRAAIDDRALDFNYPVGY